MHRRSDCEFKILGSRSHSRLTDLLSSMQVIKQKKKEKGKKEWLQFAFANYAKRGEKRGELREGKVCSVAGTFYLPARCPVIEEQN